MDGTRSERTYRLPNLTIRLTVCFSIFVFAIGGVLAVFLLSLIQQTPYPINLLVLAMLFVLFLMTLISALAYINATRTAFSVSNFGITYRTYWYKVTAEWESISGIGIRKFGLNNIEYLLLKDSVDAHLFGPISGIFRKRVSEVPVSMFDKELIEFLRMKLG